MQQVGPPTNCGVDTVKLGFWIEDCDPEILSRVNSSSKAESQAYRGSDLIEGVHLHLSATDYRPGVEGGHWFGVIEVAAMGRLVERDGFSLCPWNRVQDSLVTLVTELARRGVLVPACLHRLAGQSQCGDIACMLAPIRIYRLDVAIDFVGVSALTRYLKCMERRKQERRRGAPRRYGSQSIEIATGRTGLTCLLYDRHAKHPEIPPGTVRFEARFGKNRLKAMGMSHLTDIEAARLEAMLRKAFEWARLNEPVGGPSTIDLIASHPDLSRDSKVKLLGGLVAAEYGYDLWSSGGKYRRIARELGLVIGDPVREAASEELTCLDLRSGRERRLAP